jgi:hypothetical protein
MGMGLLLVVPAASADVALQMLAGEGALRVGELTLRSDEPVEFV